MLWHVNQALPAHSATSNVVVGGVMFQVDTDNRSNFPTERSFHTFKKQRFADSLHTVICLPI